MKRKLIIFSVAFIAIATLCSYVLFPYTMKLRTGTGYIDFEITGAIGVPTSFSNYNDYGPVLYNTLIKGGGGDILGDNNLPKFNVTYNTSAPTSVIGNNRNECGVGYNSDPDAIMFTHNLFNGSYIYESDIVVNTNFHSISSTGGTYDTNVGSNEYDRVTASRHEIGHVQGLDHSLSNSFLMYETISRGNRKTYDGDYKAGLNCIYYDSCAPYTGTGDITIETKAQKSNSDLRQLSWKISNNNSILGFNIYFSNKELNTESTYNNQLIKTEIDSSNEYKFTVINNSSNTYFLEIVYESGLRTYKNF
ncbi:matrixin family metalloprotease [Polaribacter sp. Hel1_85]|uniref:matrixin family metalloprotease n=1 Tax=Polaribacter sp. Hel1_85 TaxID=1250005 RepID=UPI00052D99F1|nr:matrixin family metalloprotease [Polaribacter sp. Hel1_85]KGL59131.1 putative peptidase, M10 family [Polaribacter sp. Hel1_85]